MIFLDEPFVSDFLKETIRKYAFPVVRTEFAENSALAGEPGLLGEDDAIEMVRANRDLKIYTSSENSIGWIADNLSFTDLPAQIDRFKNKARFREMIAPLYPDFFFKKVSLDQLDDLSLDEIPMPFIIKPTAGFFSMGVNKVSSAEKWPEILESIKSDMRKLDGLYPQQVMTSKSFIIEEYIEGTEYAVDAYFDASGEAVILTILEHVFSSGEDVSDRVYISSKKIIETYLGQFSSFLQKLGSLCGVKNFPLHVELRLAEDGALVPIEVNPMRFGGWCTTADMTYFAYGFNPYVYYLTEQKPDWPEILKGKEGKIYSIIVLDNSSGVDGNHIARFDYDHLLSHFSRPLELRRTDFRKYPVFGFLFAEVPEDDTSELDWILKSDLKEFISLKEE